MTKELEQDLHNIFSAIFSGRKVNEIDLHIVLNTLQKYTNLDIKGYCYSILEYSRYDLEYYIEDELTEDYEFDNEQHT